MAKKTKTATAPASAFRKLKPAELSAMGLSPKSERYFLIASKRPTAATTISKRQFTIKQFGAGPEKLVRARVEGERFYKSAKTREAAEKQRETRLKKPLSEKRLSEESQRAIRKTSKLEYLEGVSKVREEGKRYRLTVESRKKIPELLKRKMAGGELDWEEWHLLTDYLQTVKSPLVPRMFISPE